MEKDLVEGNIGDKGKYELKIEGMKLVAQADVLAGPLSGKLDVALDVEPVLDLLAAKAKELIPGDGLPEMGIDGLMKLLKEKLKG